MTVETKNKLGLTLKEYTCEKCGYVHATSFSLGRKMLRCRRCGKGFKE